jgi:aspartate racemase
MKRIGILGGMSWESTLDYYKLMNEEVKELLGKTHSSNLVLYSFDFHEVEKLQHENKWNQLTQLMVTEACNLKKAGAECIVIATNTMHLMAPIIETESGLEVLHIATATGKAITNKNIDEILLLGTKFTMEGTFYREILEEMKIKVSVPEETDRQIIHDIIYKELILGEITQISKEKFIDIINKSIKNGVKGVVLGCTEIPLLIQDDDVPIEVFNTTEIHAKYAIKYAIE